MHISNSATKEKNKTQTKKTPNLPKITKQNFLIWYFHSYHKEYNECKNLCSEDRDYM